MPENASDIQKAVQAVERCLGVQSPLVQELSGFAPRPGQQKMAAAVCSSLCWENPLLVEAGTGTGKTLAYLIPAVLLGLKTVVSTGTKTLQDQVSQKELVLLKKTLHPGLRWAVLKGRANYLCLRRYLDFSRQPDLSLPGARRGLAILEPWVQSTASGDLDQVRGEGLYESIIAEVTANSEQCMGGRCPKRDQCFFMEARARAAEADIIVVNHHLFLADLQLKSGGHGEALPRYQAVVFDEAHLLPEVATQIFGVTVSARRLSVFLRDLGKESRGGAEIMRASADVQDAGEKLFGAVRRLAGSRGSLSLLQRHLDELAQPGEELRGALESLAAELGVSDEEEALAARARVMAEDLMAVAQPVPGLSVAWAEAHSHNSLLHLSPVEVGPHLEAALYTEMSRLVFTSATLAAAGNLEPARIRLGLGQDTDRLVVPTPFVLDKQALLYVPKQMPPPMNRGFVDAVAREVEELVNLSRGRAFVLFTSHRNLEAVSQYLSPRLPFTCLVQGEAPRMKLLERFVEESPAVLFATASFWQGVDVPGAALSAVIIDKLPFSPPDDPLVAARMAKLEAEGKSGFSQLMLPEAVLSLRQGLGRLLRTHDDRGLLAVLDIRLRSKGYGRVFLRALKPAPVTASKEDVAEFFALEGGRDPA